MGSVVKTVIVNAPISQVFSFWKNFENFPRFMENVESIQITGPDETHWKAKGPLGTAIEWDAKTTYVEENKKIAWQSTGGQIETHGAVTFESAGTDQTKVTVGLEYDPAGGALGEAVARLFSDPEAKLEEDLHRFKKVAEDGAIADNAPTGADGKTNADHTAAPQ